MLSGWPMPTSGAMSRSYAPALVTCDVDNVGSRKVIESNGGILDDQRGDKLRFWIPVAA